MREIINFGCLVLIGIGALIAFAAVIGLSGPGAVVAAGIAAVIGLTVAIYRGMLR